MIKILLHVFFDPSPDLSPRTVSALALRALADTVYSGWDQGWDQKTRVIIYIGLPIIVVLCYKYIGLPIIVVMYYKYICLPIIVVPCYILRRKSLVSTDTACNSFVRQSWYWQKPY